jgi:lipopolysaccharide export system permease protein
MTLDRYLLKQFAPVFAAGMALFILLLELIELFANLWRYLAYDASITDILRVALYYMPKCASFALPVALLFAAAYVLGDLYARNELTIVFASGVPLARLTFSFLLVGAVLSVASFFFEDGIVVPALKVKREISQELLHKRQSGSEADVVVKAEGGRVVYSIDFYNDADSSLNGVSIVERDDDGRFLSLINSRRATWNGIFWTFEDPVSYKWSTGRIKNAVFQNDGRYREQPATFRRNAVEVEDLKAAEAAAFVSDLREAGLPYAGALSDYYRRFAFSVTPLVVMILSVAVGGGFRKNILLMSLLTSLISSVIYYVVQMLSMMLAKLGYIPPVIGAWAPAGVFILVGVLLVRRART